MATTIRAYTLDAFISDYLPAQRPARGIRATVLHHTWSPNAAQYRGLSTIQAIQRYHMQERGWRDIGANAYAAPDGFVYNGRPLSDSNYAHAQISRPWAQVPADLRALAGGNRQFLNYYAFGIETIGNFDAEPIEPLPLALDTAFAVLAAVHRQYGLEAERLFLHRDAAAKSCPGNNITREWAREELARRLNGMEPAPADRPLMVVRLPGSYIVDCRPELVDGVTRCDLRPIAEALGWEVIADHLPMQNKLYLRRPEAQHD